MHKHTTWCWKPWNNKSWSLTRFKNPCFSASNCIFFFRIIRFPAWLICSRGRFGESMHYVQNLIKCFSQYLFSHSWKRTRKHVLLLRNIPEGLHPVGAPDLLSALLRNPDDVLFCSFDQRKMFFWLPFIDSPLHPPTRTSLLSNINRILLLKHFTA